MIMHDESIQINQNTQENVFVIEKCQPESIGDESVNEDANLAKSMQEKLFVDEGCQVDLENTCLESTFTCNRYIYSDGYCEVEIQTEIKCVYKNCICQKKSFQSKKVGTSQKSFTDQSVGPCFESEEFFKYIRMTGFTGISSVADDEQLSDLAGVTFESFKFLQERLDVAENCTVTKENRLLIFLMKMKTGLTYSALNALFGVNRRTIARIFVKIVQDLSSATANVVFWPSKDVVQGTMPECFKPAYSNTRVIIDCTEFRIEVPSAVDYRVLCYSHYKKGFTAKVLIACTPGGFICFKSDAAGGRKSDSQITIESGFIDLLEDGDVVLSDKGFPEIRSKIDESGKKAFIIMPPFLENKTAFTEEETSETYAIAKVRIHVERVMQRLRTYKILDKIPKHLFHHIDDIIHVCCVLVNLQPPIIRVEEKEKEEMG